MFEKKVHLFKSYTPILDLLFKYLYHLNMYIYYQVCRHCLTKRPKNKDAEPNTETQLFLKPILQV